MKIIKKEENRIIIEAKTKEEAIREGVKQLGTDIKNIVFKVIKEGRVGILKNKPYVILIEKKTSAKEERVERLIDDADVLLEKIESENKEFLDVEFDDLIGNYEELPEKVREEIHTLSKELKVSSLDALSADAAADGVFDIEVSEDEMKVYLTIEPPIGAGGFVEKEDILDALNEDEIVYGINEKAIEEAVEKVKSELEKVKDAVIAEGKNPTESIKGRIEFLYLENDKKNGKSKVDFKEKKHSDIVEEGQEIAKWIEPKIGESGVNVYGEEIQAVVAEDTFPKIGEGVYYDEDKQVFISQLNGRVIFENNELKVIKRLVVEGNIDYSSGNIDFDGEVIIPGDVLSGFIVKATKKIQIAGIVDGAFLECSNGEIEVKKGIHGKGKAVIKAAGDINTKFIDNAIIFTKASLYVEEYILNSEVTAVKEVIVKSDKASIVGGIIKAGVSVSSLNIGSERGVATKIYCGINLENIDQLMELESKIAKIKKAIDDINKYIEKFEYFIKNKKDFSQDKRKAYIELKRKKIILEYKLEQIKEEKEKLAENKKPDPNAKVYVKGTAYMDTFLKIGASSLKLDRDMEYIVFYEDTANRRIVNYPYS